MPQLVAIRTEASEDESHEHVTLVGYFSPHIEHEPIMITPARVKNLMQVLESFWIEIDGQRIDVEPGTCPVCGIEPYLRTKADSGTTEKLKDLPQA